jgi:hypothetical protein
MSPSKKAKQIQRNIVSRKKRLQTRTELMSSYNHNSDTSHPAIQIVLKEFFKAIDQGPTFICICCNRFLYHGAMLSFNENNFNDTRVFLITNFQLVKIFKVQIINVAACLFN